MGVPGFPLKNIILNRLRFSLPDCSTLIFISFDREIESIKNKIQKLVVTVYYFRFCGFWTVFSLGAPVFLPSRSHLLVVPLGAFLPRYAFLYFLGTEKVTSLPAVRNAWKMKVILIPCHALNWRAILDEIDHGSERSRWRWDHGENARFMVYKWPSSQIGWK